MNKNLRDYINLVEERTDRFGNPYNPTVNPHAAVDAAASAPVSTAPKSTQTQKWKTVPGGGGQVNVAGFNTQTKTTAGGTKPKRPVTKPGLTTPVKQPAVKSAAVTPIKSKTGAPSTSTSGQAAKAKPAAAPTFSGQQYGFQSPEDVKGIQQMLVNMGYAMPVDGKWGPKTDSAFNAAYQQMYGTAPGQAAPVQAPPAGQAKPDEWTQARQQKQDLSKDMAAAAGMPNPFAPLKESVEELSRIKSLVNYNK